MPITDISVRDIAPFADGGEFGAAGAYVRSKGSARGTLESAAPEKEGDADLALAPRNAAGLVEWARLRHPAAPGPAARQRDPRLRRDQSRQQAHPATARRRAAEQPRRRQRPEDPRRCRPRLHLAARLFARLVGLGPRRAARP